jgi:hypothetical protein
MLLSKIVVAILLWPAPAGAQARDGGVTLAGDLGMGALDGKAWATVQTGVDIRERNLALGLFGRVRLRLQEVEGEGAVRRRDWDEATDYVHILRYLHYRRSFGALRLEAQEGEIGGLTLGHGSLIRDYSNVADPDHPHSGLRLRLESPRLVGEALIDNFVRPSVIGLRLEAVPASALPRLRLGFTAVVDPRAPLAIRRGAAGERVVDSAWNLQADGEALALLGLDVEHRWVARDGEAWQVTPYADLASSLHGVGLHLGSSGRVRLGRGRRPFLGGQLEYRASSGGYAPAHVETFYDLERYQAALSLGDPGSPAARAAGAGEPKLAGLKGGLYGGHGLLAQLSLEHERLVRVRLGFSRRPGPDANTLFVRVASAPSARLDLGLLIVARGLGQVGADATALAAMAEARLALTRNLYALGQYARVWSLDPASRYFSILQSFNASLGATWSG